MSSISRENAALAVAVSTAVREKAPQATALTKPSMPPCWLQYFSGEWRAVRKLYDRRSGQSGAALGAARFLPQAGAKALECRENFLISFGGRRWPAYQMFVWRFSDTGAADIHNSSGALICALRHQDEAGRLSADHDFICGQDRYHGAIEFLSDTAWRMEWRAIGPCKDYILRTRYSKCDDARPAG